MVVTATPSAEAVGRTTHVWSRPSRPTAGRVFLANVGVNASHRLVSPVDASGAFTLVTIPESAGLSGETLVRYGDVAAFGGLVPERLWDRPTHYDPEFETLTYGDNCSRAARAAALRQAREGDFIAFIARLVQGDRPCFGLVGILEIESILRDVRRQPGGMEMQRYGANAHVRRALADPRYWDGFWVFAGTPSSGLLPRAAPIGRDEAELLLRDRAGRPWSWRPGRSDLQTIGSYTRTCRCILDASLDGPRWQAFWDLIEAALC